MNYIEKSSKVGVGSLRLSFFGGFGSYIKIFPFVVTYVHVRHVHYRAAKSPQKEIDRPAQGKRSIL